MFLMISLFLARSLRTALSQCLGEQPVSVLAGAPPA
jgi:hypothetical protein